MAAEIPPLGIGEFTTSSGNDADLGNIYAINNGMWRLVVLTAAVSSAGGKALIHVVSAGVPTNAVQENTTLGVTTFAGVIPISTAITTTTTLAAGSRLLIQFRGPCSTRTVTTTMTASALMVGTVAGGVSSITTGVEASSAVSQYIGYSTNTAVATVANGVITCVLAGC